MRRRILSLVSALALAALVVSCAAPATTGGAAPAAPAADSGAAAPATEGLADVPREKTLIIGFEGGPSAAPENFGLNPAAGTSQGGHQVMIESPYYLNYETGELVPWLAADQPTFNDDFTQVT